MESTSLPEAVPQRGEPRSRRESFWVGAFITATALVVVLILAMICWRWLKVVEPTAMIVLIGAPVHDGTTVDVVDLNGASQLKEPVVLDAKNDYQTPVMLVPGRYVVTATQKDGRTLLKQEFTLLAYRGLQFELPKVQAASATTQDTVY
jgi:hypothetical protein